MKDEQHAVCLDECEEIGSAELGTPLPAQSQIDVTYTLDLEGILKVEALDVTTRAKAVGEFKSGALLAANELANSRNRIMAVEIS